MAARGPTVVTTPAEVIFQPQTRESHIVTRFFVTTASDTTALHLVVPIPTLGADLLEWSRKRFRSCGSLLVSAFVQ